MTIQQDETGHVEGFRIVCQVGLTEVLVVKGQGHETINIFWVTRSKVKVNRG